MRNDDTRYKILRTIIDAKKPLSLSAIAKKMKIPSQKISYHLDFLCEDGIIIRDGYTYFPQSALVDPELREFCAEKISEIIAAFSEQDNRVAVVNGQDPEDVIINLLYALVQIELP